MAAGATHLAPISESERSGAGGAIADADASAGGTVITDDWAYSDEQYAFYAEHYPEYALEDEAIAEAYRRVAEKRASAGDED